jgi:ATP-dependent DNA helicase RecQ
MVAQKRHAYARLAQMTAFATIRSCRHARIADYFGEVGVARTCQACDNCLAGERPAGALVAAEVVRAALAGAARFSGRIGLVNLAAVLGGRDTKWTREHTWVREVPAHNALPGWSEDRVRRLFAELMETGLVGQTPGQYPMVMLTDQGKDVLAGRSDAAVSLPEEPAAPPPADATADHSLFERLRRWRGEVARRDGVPAYVVFHDRALMELAARRPPDLEQLATVPGVGPGKLARYGSELLALISDAKADSGSSATGSSATGSSATGSLAAGSSAPGSFAVGSAGTESAGTRSSRADSPTSGTSSSSGGSDAHQPS